MSSRHPRRAFKRKRVHHGKDKKKLIVIAHLASTHPLGDTKNGIMADSRLRTQEGGSFSSLMGDLVGMDWVEKRGPPNVGGHDYYVVTDKGKDALYMAKKLARDEHPLSSLDVFEGILD